MNNRFFILPTVLFALSSIATQVQAVDIVDESNTKAVGHVKWNLQTEIDPQELINKSIPADSVSIFFIRPKDNDPEQTSANIAINDRFQVSLQPGSYTQVFSCAGINRLSGEITGLKTNDLLLDTKAYQLEDQGIYFFYTNVDEEGQSSIQPLTKESALEQLAVTSYQSHQITRVVPNCPVIAQQPPTPEAPILEKEVNIELEVLFDTDKSIIKPEFLNEVKEVADFMTLYANTTAVIEGHTDSRASDAYNQKLSERRANAVKDMLINRYGISPQRLSAIGYGESRPRATNGTKEGRQLNRRTIAVINEIVRLDQDGNVLLK